MRRVELVAFVHYDVGVFLLLSLASYIKALRRGKTILQKAVIGHHPLLVIELPTKFAEVQLSPREICSWIADDINARSRVLHILDESIGPELPDLIRGLVIPIELAAMHLQEVRAILHIEALAWVETVFDEPDHRALFEVKRRLRVLHERGDSRQPGDQGLHIHCGRMILGPCWRCAHLHCFIVASIVRGVHALSAVAAWAAPDSRIGHGPLCHSQTVVLGRRGERGCSEQG